jgi:hypothetical protein
LDATTLPVSLRANDQSRARSAAGPDGWLVTWRESWFPDSRLYARRLAWDGTPVGDLLQLSAVDQWPYGDPLVAGSSSGWLVVWQGELATLMSRRISATGELGEPLRLGGAVSYQVVRGPSDWLLTWVRGPHAGRGTVVARRFDFSGTPIDANPIEISEDDEATSVDVDPRGSGYVVSWVGVDGGLYARDVNFAAEPVNERIVILPPSSRTLGARLAFSEGSGWLLSFGEQRGEQWEFRPLLPDAAVQSWDHPIYSLDVTGVSGQGLVAWSDADSGRLRVALAPAGAGYVELARPPFSTGTTEAALSPESSRSTLMTFAQTSPINGMPTGRLSSSVLRLSPADAGPPGDTDGAVVDASLEAGEDGPDSAVDAGSKTDASSDARHDASKPGSDDPGDDGCSCRVTPSQERGYSLAWILSAFAWLARSKLRRRNERCRASFLRFGPG